jgi:hypothetical protein
MNEATSFRRNKISLSDYNYRKDIENRMLMAHFTTTDLEILEEILYSSLLIPIKKLAKSVDVDEADLTAILNKLGETGLFTLSDDSIVVDKEMRKYFEAQIVKFEENFVPGMEFLQCLLRKVPIHVLPTWYAIPRTSDNIFDSLVEKYLYTPQTFQRYLSELNSADPQLGAIIAEVHAAPDFALPSTTIMEKFGFSREQFEEHMLHLEFNLVCCLCYKKENDVWKEVVTPFQEWRDYLLFLRDTTPTAIAKPDKIERRRPGDFAFIQDLSAILSLARKAPLALSPSKEGLYIPEKSALAQILSKCPGLDESYIHQLISKLILLKLAQVVDGKLNALEAANDWLDMRFENQALYLYRHPLNRPLSPNLPPQYERHLREAEKSILRALTSGWVYFDDFIQGSLATFGEDSSICLKRLGKSWKYLLPQYSEEQRSLIKAAIFDWLFEIGVVATGVHNGKECFCVTPFGQSLFGR